ncbi:putative ribonuclease H-like domain-containing protein [Tanacetum coccineum]
MAFVSSPGTTNEVDTANIQVSIVNTTVSTPSTHDNTANLSDATVYAFMANQPNRSHLVHEDLEQIYEDDLEEMDLKWQLALLSMRARRPRNQDSSKRTVNVEDTSSKAMVAFDGAGFDWSFMTDEEVPTNMALMAFSDSEPEFEGYGLKANKSVCENSSNEIKKTPDALIIEEWVSNSDEDESKVMVLKSDNVQHKSEQANQPRKVNSVNTSKGNKVKSAIGEQGINVVKSSACWVWRPKIKIQDHGDPQDALKDTGIFNSGCSKHMTGNKSYLTDYQDYDGGFVAFVGSSKEGKITGKGKIRTGKLDFEDVYFVKELKFNLFSVSQMCDRKNSVLFSETECPILSPDFKLPNDSQVMLKVPRKNNMYSFNLNNVVPSKGLTCLFTKATNDESKLWHRRLGHINFKTMNKLVKGNLVRGLPSNIFENDHTCVASQKGKQRKATSKNDETSGILKDFITDIENQLNHKVKIIICDNGTEFKNYEMNQFCEIKGIKREFSNARNPQQNGVTKRKNRTLIEAARTMLADSLLPIPFWAEAINTACYVQNMVLVTKPHNKTPYELLISRTYIISFMRPFGSPITILNTLDHLGKFDRKADEGFLVGYSINSKAFRVFNSRTRKVKENLHVNFLENKPNVAGIRLEWLFDIDSLTNSMNYQPISAGNRTNSYAGLETNSDAGQDGKEKVPDQEYILLPLLQTSSYVPSSFEEAESSPKDDAGKKATKQPSCNKGGKADDLRSLNQKVKSEDAAENINNTNSINTASPTVNVAGVEDGNFHSTNDELVFSTPIIINAASLSFGHPDALEDHSKMTNLEDTDIFDDAYDDRDEGAEADYNNLETIILVNPIPSTRENKDHPKDPIIREVDKKNDQAE